MMNEMEATVFNEAQLQMLSMFRFSKTQEEVDDLKSVLLAHYAERMQEMADKMWDDGLLDNTAIEGILSEHLRTPYMP